MSNEVSHRHTIDGAPSNSTASGVQAKRALAFLKHRQALAGSAIVLASILWIAGLTLPGTGINTLPWCLTLSAITFGAAYLTYRQYVCVTSVVRTMGGEPPLSLTESYALTYLAASLVLCFLIAAPTFLKTSQPKVATQVIDIELNGLTDFQNHKQLLPSTKEMPSLRKRTSPNTQTIAGTLEPTPTASGKPKPKSQACNTDSHHTLALQQATTAPHISRLAVIPRTNASPSQIPDSTKLSSSANAHLPVFTPQSQEAQRRPADSSRHLSPEEFMKEVDPPELVELMDSEGNQGQHVWQPGGRSSGGTGAASELAHYLKELHKRIKAAWSPPAGQARTTEILFRIRRSGDLILVKVLRSSQDNQSDGQAIKAITASAPFNKLPSDYTLPYLDIKYTFNYSVDQLSEVHTQTMY